MWDKARHGNEEQVREAFEDFRGQDPRGRPLFRRRPDGPSGSGPERPEPQHRQPPLPRALRERILLACEAQRPLFGTVEIDESFFGARRVKGRRGRGACSKTAVFGIFERQGQVYTEIVPDCSKPTLQSIIRGWVDPRTVINSDGWPGYNGLVDLGYGHFRVDHSRDERGAVHINDIEGFWGLAKVRLTKFKGLPRHTFPLHLKETEWRYNHRHDDKYQMPRLGKEGCDLALPRVAPPGRYLGSSLRRTRLPSPVARLETSATAFATLCKEISVR